MSLHQLANHMSARGRGPDSTLVHMSPREVEGLQKLAVANGTSLTINPDTGLPEAFSLQDLLPTLIGGAATYFTGGAITPLMAALGTGAVTALTSKDLGKGLMAGLGAYGGAGIVSGLAGFGTGALSAEAGAAATQAAGAATSPLESEILSQAAIAPKLAGASYADKFGAGLSKAMSDPMGAASAIGGGSKIAGLTKVAGAISPLLAGETGNTVQTVTKRPSTAMIRPYRYDNMSQTFEEGTPYAAANGGLMRLAHGGSVGYSGGGMSIDDAYRSVLGREPDAAGKAYWSQANIFGDTVDANELASFRASALGGTDTADKAAAQNFGISNAGAGFAAAAPVATQATLAAPAPAAAQVAQVAQAAPAARVVETAPLAAAQVFPQAGTGIAALSNAGAATSEPPSPSIASRDAKAEAARAPERDARADEAAWTAARTAAINNTATTAGTTAGTGTTGTTYSNTAGTGTPGATTAGTTAGTTGATGIAALPPLTDQVYDLFMSTVDRPPSESDMAYWKTQFGINNNTIDPNEIADFKSAASGEIGRRQASTSGKDYMLNTDANREALYQSILTRSGEQAGMDFWKKSFGDYIDPKELAGFKTEAAKEIARRPVVVNPVVQNPAVVTDLTTAGSQYIAPGVGGSSGAGQIGGGTTINPNGTITTSPRISGIPVGGFSGMTNVKRTYTDSGGDLGYTPPTYTKEAFDAKYKNTGYQKEMYDYLMGKGDKPTKMKNADGTFREVARSYKEAVLGVPGSTNKRLTWNPKEGEYFRNPDYVRTARAPILDAAGKQKRDADGNYLYNTTTYKSINQAKASLADNKLNKDSGAALFKWANTNNIDEQTVADALGLSLEDVISKFAKVKDDETVKVKNGGLMQLANGGAIRYNGASGNSFVGTGGGVKPDFTAHDGEVFLWDWENGKYRPKEMTKDGKSYTWDKISNRYKPAGAGIAGLLDMSGGSNAGDARGPGTGTTTPIENNGFFSSILGRTTQGSAPVVTRDMYTPSAQAEREARLGRYSGLSGLQARQAETDAEAALNAESQALAKQTHINLTTQYEDALKAAADRAALDAEAQERGFLSRQDEADAAVINSANAAKEARDNAAIAAALANTTGVSLAAPTVTAGGVYVDAKNAAAANATLSAAEAAAADTSGTGGFTSGANADGYGGGDLGAFLANGGYIGHYAQGGLGSLGGYSDGGRLLRGPGDGVSDSIPASIGNRQPARLADGEFVVPARIVSELGNGSTEAGARALYKMMARIQANRRKTTGRTRVAVDSKSHKYLPA